MKTTATIRQRIIADAILTMFVKGEINTQSDVDAVMNKIQNRSYLQPVITQ